MRVGQGIFNRYCAGNAVAERLNASLAGRKKARPCLAVRARRTRRRGNGGSIWEGIARTLRPVIVSRFIRWVLIAHVLGALPLLAAGDGLAARIVILANSSDPESVQLAEFYAAKRAVPRRNIVALPMPEAETLSWREFIDRIYVPVQGELYNRGWLDGTTSKLTDRLGRRRYAFAGHHISYLVVCRGVPLRIKNDSALLDEATGLKVGRLRYKNEAAVDSELSLLAQSGYEITGTTPNPFFAKERVSVIDARTAIKVSRLDGPTMQSAQNLVTSALAAEETGLIGRGYVDLKGPHPDGDAWLAAALQQLEELGFDGEVERTAATFEPAARFDAPAFYFGWYANDLNGPFAVGNFKFPAGAIAVHIHSYSAQTLRSDTQGWSGPLVARGVTATVGNVFEPYLQLTHHPDLLLRALSRGQNFGDAAYYALPVLSWQSIAIGDPLYRPFKVSLEQQERQLDQLPPELAPYVLLRRANGLLRQRKTNEAWTLLRNGLTERPSLILALACARLAAGRNSVPAAVEAMNSFVLPEEFRAEDWALARELAVRLAASGAQPAALKVYAKLVKTAAPTLAAQVGLLHEAQAVAKAAGDEAAAREFSQQLSARDLPPVAR